MSDIFLVGRPNVGKSYLFNRITKSEQKIANFAGVTVEKTSKTLTNTDLNLIDLPGINSLKSTSFDEAITLKSLTESSPEDLICLVIDVLKLKSQIDFLIEFRDWCQQNFRPLVLCLNMKDEADKYKIQIDTLQIQSLVQIPVFFVSAKTEEGLEELKSFFSQQKWSSPDLLFSEDNMDRSSAEEKHEKTNSQVKSGNSSVRETQNQQNLKKALMRCVSGDLSEVIKTQNRLDQFFLSPIVGPFLFLSFTFIVFQSIFSWAEPFMNFIEIGISKLSNLVSPFFASQFNDHVQSFVDNAIFAGFGAFLVFTPQIFILTFIITFLEKSGYMTRAVLICHQPLSWFGLHGKSFIPLMTGHACAVPAIYATRSIENDWIRKLTIFVLPLTACSARIPVYALLIQLLIPNKTIFFGLFGTQGLVFFLLYFFGIFMALLISATISKFSNVKAYKDDFIVELPKYRWPELQMLFSKSFKTTTDFIKDAGPVIFILNATIWVLSSYPINNIGLKGSYMAQFGQWIEPIFRPIGLDWIQGVAVLSSFVAREVFVSTLGLLYGLNEDQSENLNKLASLTEMKDLSFASGFSLLMFFAIALQCMSTVSVMQKEGGTKMAYTALFFYLVLGYSVAFISYQTLNLIF